MAVYKFIGYTCARAHNMRPLHARTVLHTQRATWATRIQCFRQIYISSTLPAYSTVTLRKSVYKCNTWQIELIDTHNIPSLERFYPIPLLRYSGRKTSSFFENSIKSIGVNFNGWHLRWTWRYVKVLAQPNLDLGKTRRTVQFHPISYSTFREMWARKWRKTRKIAKMAFLNPWISGTGRDIDIRFALSDGPQLGLCTDAVSSEFVF